MDLRSLNIFVKVAQERSFARASQELGMTASGVSNAIARLEDRLGVRLLARTTRSVNLTDDGAAFFERCRQILLDLEEAEQVLARARLEPRGRLRLDLPVAFGRRRVVPLLGDFLALHPDITVAVTLSDRPADLIEDRIDVALRFGALQDSRLVVRRLTTIRPVLCASPDYLARHGRPQQPEDLRAAGHRGIALFSRERGGMLDWRFSRAGESLSLPPPAVLALSDVGAVLDCVRAGLGLAQLDDYLVAAELRRGELVSVLDDAAPTDSTPVSVVYPQGRHLSPKVRVFVDFLAERLNPDRAGPDRAGPIAPLSDPVAPADGGALKTGQSDAP